MIHNYLKIAWRNMLKYRLFSFINILGLSLAIPSALMALIQIVTYYEYDNFHPDTGRIVRVITDERKKDGDITKWASSPAPLGSYLKENLAGIEQATTIIRDNKWNLSNGIKTKDIHAIYADNFFFQMFNFPLEKGTYPAEPNAILLTHEMAEWFFRDASPIGGILGHPKYGNFKVAGVLKPFNQQKTQFRTDIFLPMASYSAHQGNDINWSQLNAHTFVKMQNESNVSNLDQVLTKTSDEINKLIGPASDSKLHFKAQRFADISPSADMLENDPYIQDIRSIYINFAFQLIIIFLAALNYINLTLARSMNRSREVGVRKVAGATRTQLVFQFLTESVLISYLSLGIGLMLLWFIKTQIHVSWLTWDIDHLGYLILLFFIFNLILGLVAGASPSLILSSYQPVKVLKGSVSPASFGKIGFRKLLIIIQFTVALVYIFFIAQAFHQTRYMATDNDNYRRENILNINIQNVKSAQFAADISTIKEVEKTGHASLSFGNTPVYASIKNTGNSPAQNAFYYSADRSFIDNMNLKIVAGKNMLPEHPDTPSPVILVNQKAVEKLKLGSEKDAIGKLIILNDTLKLTIAGVVADFCNNDYESKIEPVIFEYRPELFRIMCIRTAPTRNRKAVESAIETVWKKHLPFQEMNASWMDTDMYERYFPRADIQFMWMESVAIFVIAILGLIGILTYGLEKRTKEIGIRKVIGATTPEIIQLMSRDFLKLLSIATIIALPAGIAVAFYMNSYLVFNDGIGYIMMALLLVFVLGVALAAIGYFSWDAARRNPATTLKVE